MANRLVTDDWIKRLYTYYIKNLQIAITSKDIVQIGLDFNALKGFLSSLDVSEEIPEK
jgi:hypothetical protein